MTCCWPGMWGNFKRKSPYFSAGLLALDSETDYPVADNKKAFPAIMTVSYTPGQLRSATSIAPETYRHWKKVLTPLRRDKGHSPCFTSGDIIAVSIVQRLSTDFGIRIGALAPIAESLFDFCNSTPWPTLERGKIMVDLKNAKIEFRAELSDYLHDDIMIIVPLRPIVTKLREQLLTAAEADRQSSLPFPLVSVPSSVTPAVMGGQS